MDGIGTDLAATRDRIDAAWQDLLAAIDGLTDDALQEPGVTGDWSVRDILAHVAIWDAAALDALPGILATGQHPDHDEDIDTFNARTTAETRHRSLDAVREALHATHQRLLAYLDAVDPAAFAGNAAFRQRLASDTWDHYPDHAAAIRTWRARRA